MAKEKWGPRESVLRFSGERTSSGMNEFSCLQGNERYGACEDAVMD